jgi:hypothetical protein
MPRRRQQESIERDARALDLHCQGMTYQQIATALGWKGSGTAFHAVKRGIADRQRNALAQVDHFTLAVERIQDGLRKCQEIIETEHFAVAPGGKIATIWDSGSQMEVPVLDDGPKQRAITEMRHLNDQLIRLQGLNAPTKQRVEVVTQDVVNDEIARLVNEVRELANASETAGPGIPVEP